jgi:MFS family permease
MSLAMFALVAGEQLWGRFMPKYLSALGAPALALGMWGSAKDFLDASLQYPGGALSDRYGAQRSLMVFTAIAGLGYAAYFAAPSWPWLFVGLVLSAAWGSLASPAMFALIAESLPHGQRARGFMVQSVLRRVPILFAPTLGGLLVERRGLAGGLRIGFLTSIALALVTLLFQRSFYRPPAQRPAPRMLGLLGLWRIAPPPLKRLLAADVLARCAESAADVFVVLYALDHLHASPVRYGAWIGLQTAVSIVSYFPGAWIADRLGRKPPVIFTFLMFALFPLLVGLARDTGALTVAFVAAGLRELGEPARKSLIVDASPEGARGATVGAYYLARSVMILPAGVVGGLLWARDPHAPFWAATAVGLVGVVYFVFRFHEPRVPA